MFPQHSDHPPLHLRPRLCGCLLHPHPVRHHWARHGAWLPVLVWCRDLRLCHLPPAPPHCVWDSQLLQGLHDLQDAPHQPDPGCQDQHRRHCHHQYHSLPVPRSGNILVLIMKLLFIIFWHYRNHWTCGRFSCWRDKVMLDSKMKLMEFFTKLWWPRTSSWSSSTSWFPLSPFSTASSPAIVAMDAVVRPLIS